MTVDRIPPAISALTSQAGHAGGASDFAGSGARSVAFDIAGRIASEFLAGHTGSSQAVSYPIGELADALGQSLGATALETIDIEWAMEQLAGAVAADMAALADGGTLDRLDQGIAALGSMPATPANVANSIEEIAAFVAAAK